MVPRPPPRCGWTVISESIGRLPVHAMARSSMPWTLGSAKFE